MKQEFLEAYEKLFNDAYNRLRRSLTLKLKAMKICSEKEEENKTARSRKSFGDIDQDPKDISQQLKFSSQEQADLKADQINYEIEAIQLNKIDEESIENSSENSS